MFREDVFGKFTDLVRIHMASEVLNGMNKVDLEIAESSHFVEITSGKLVLRGLKLKDKKSKTEFLSSFHYVLCMPTGVLGAGRWHVEERRLR